MSDSNRSLFETIASVFVPIHRDGHKFVAIAIVLSLLLFLVWDALGWIAGLAALFIAYFFRDPDRISPVREGLVVSAADGRVAAIEEVRPPVDLGLGEEPRKRVSVFLSVFDVHINRSPVTGRIKLASYMPGLFLNAELDKASEDNERRSLVIETSTGVEVGVVQIAGLVARRIVPFVEEGQPIGIGERFGLIRFGSRVDIYLPENTGIMVAVGQRAIAGETVIADLKGTEQDREARLS